MQTRRCLVAASLAAVLASCAATTPPVKDGRMGGITVLPIKPSVFVRATFDSDASELIGAFIPDDVTDDQIDESVLSKTRCSDYIRVKTVPAGGRTEDVFGASQGAGGKFGVKEIAQVKGEFKNTNALRIGCRTAAPRRLTSAPSATCRPRSRARA
jgi:hypothetical protein